MSDVIQVGYEREEGYVKLYYEMYDLYNVLISKSDGIAYHGYLKRYINRDIKNKNIGYAFPSVRKIKEDLGLGADKIKECELKCLAWGLLDVKRQKGMSNLYKLNDPLTQKDLFDMVESGGLPKDLSVYCPELLPDKDEKKKQKILNDILNDALLLKSSNVFLDRNGNKNAGVPKQEQSDNCSQTGTDEFPDRNGSVPNQESKYINKNIKINNIFNQAKEKIKNELTEATYNAWFKELILINFEQNNLILGISSDFAKGILESKFVSLIENTIEGITGERYNIIFTTY